MAVLIYDSVSQCLFLQLKCISFQLSKMVLTLAHEIYYVTSRKVPVVLIAESKSLFDTITKVNTVSEEHPLVEISVIQEKNRNE